jgi:hypothetical protein
MPESLIVSLSRCSRKHLHEFHEKARKDMNVCSPACRAAMNRPPSIDVHHKANKVVPLFRTRV